MNRELKKVKKWPDSNRLSLNIGKTNLVIFHSPHAKLLESVVIRFCRKQIQPRNYANLNWKHHINELLKKLARTICIFYNIWHFVPYEILRLLYYSLFY